MLSGESKALLSCLSSQRDHVLGTLDGLPEEALRRRVLPSGWTWRLANLREVLLHVITETACHAGHLDAARELIDGRKWMVLT